MWTQHTNPFYARCFYKWSTECLFCLQVAKHLRLRGQKSIKNTLALKNPFKLHTYCSFQSITHESHVRTGQRSSQISLLCLLQRARGAAPLYYFISLNFVTASCHFITPPCCQAGQLTINSCLWRLGPCSPRPSSHLHHLHLRVIFFNSPFIALQYRLLSWSLLWPSTCLISPPGQEIKIL